MLHISARDAIRNKRDAGDFAQWSFWTADAAVNGYEEATGDMAARRVFRDFIPLIKPKFTLGKDAAIFASGSCFAREIEYALHSLGNTVLSWTPEETRTSPGSFNRYNTFSVINDFRRSATGEVDEDSVWQTPIGWIDYSTHGPNETYESFVAARDALIDIHRQIRNADVFILTLGLIETWYDLKLSTYLNITPSEVLVGNTKRFECRITDYQDNLEAVRFLISYLRDHFNPDLKVILTVSPVPLNVSFVGKDIVQSNTSSKAVLRAVAQKIADDDDNVDYFPSYEMVMMSDPASSWLPDYRHVRRDRVASIMGAFTTAYLV